MTRTDKSVNKSSKKSDKSRKSVTRFEFSLFNDSSFTHYSIESLIRVSDWSRYFSPQWMTSHFAL